MKHGILFLGDSFTWGEGLELYCNTPKWIAERTQDNTWSALMHKQDMDGVSFREENRFARLVAKHFNKHSFVSLNNGGTLASNISTAHRFLFNPNLYIDTIIIQFSSFSREALHLTSNCMCDTCVLGREDGNGDINRPFSGWLMHNVLTKVLQKESLNDKETYLLDFYKKITGLDTDNPEFLNVLNKKRYEWYESVFYIFFNTIIEWESDGKRKIYFIDTWERDTSDFIFTTDNSFIHRYRNNFIPLVSKDNEKYVRYNDWETHFGKTRIISDFPKTNNDHMSLEQHQYVAKSIIQFLENKNYE